MNFRKEIGRECLMEINNMKGKEYLIKDEQKEICQFKQEIERERKGKVF